MLAPPPLPRTLTACLRDLDSTKPDVRRSAIVELVPYAQNDSALRAQSIRTLERLLESDEVPVVRSAAALALSDLGAIESLAKLLVAVEDEDAGVRQMALAALGELRDGRALPRLVRALSDPRPEIRYQAIIAFARAACEEDVPAALAEGLSDEDPEIRYIAVRLIEERFGTDAFRAVLSEHGGVRAILRRLLEDASAPVRVAAAILLARLGDPSAQPLLLAVVRGGVKIAEEDEGAALELVGALGLTDAIPLLERRAWGWRAWLGETSFFAKVALARLGNVRARDEIERDLHSVRKRVRERAMAAAGRARLRHLEATIRALEAVDPTLQKEALVDMCKEDAS